MELLVSTPISVPLLTAYDPLCTWTQSLPYRFRDWAPGQGAFSALSSGSPAEEMLPFEFREHIGPLALVVRATMTEIEPPRRIAWKATSVHAKVLSVRLPGVALS